MNNYQLYRTNAKLGGQVAWNLVLEDTASGKLTVKYFDLTPISPNVNYRYGQNRDCVRYSHQENLRTLYKEIKGQFYDAVIDPRLTTIYPILDEDDKITWDNSLDMGCSRISLSRYGKQLQVFCPLWLEDFKKDDVLSFEVSLYTYSKENSSTVENVLSSKRLSLKLRNDNSYHDRFVNYFKNYLNDIIKSDIIGDDVLNINITEKFASVHGLDIKTGKLASKDISTLVPNLFDRERPLMETDFMLIDNYHTSTMIAKQLFNFNLVFDIADLVSNTMNNMLNDNEFFIKVDVYKNGQQLEKRSFNNNYSSLERPNVDFGEVFKYLQDDRCIDTIRDNKLAPDICHWTLNDNDNYIFNVYPGFGTTYDMFYKDAPNYWEYDAAKYPNVLNWINNFKIDNFDSVLTDIIFKPSFTTFDPDSTFVENTRIDTAKITEETEKEYLASFVIEGSSRRTQDVNSVINSLRTNNLTDYVFLVPNNDEVTVFVSNVSTIFKEDCERISGHEDSVNQHGFVVFSLTHMTNRYILVANQMDQNLLSFKWMSKVIPVLRQCFKEENNSVKTIDNILKALEIPKFIYLYNSLGIKRADSPWVETKEIYYVKVNNKSNIVIRYDGKIKPMFSAFDDLVMYRVRKMTAEEFSSDPAFQKDRTQGFLPNYPSVSYFNLEYLNEDNYYKNNEYKWFSNSLVFNIVSNISVKIYSKHLSHYYTNDELVEKVLTETYPNLSSKYLPYLRSLYNVDISYEYDEPAWNPITNQFDYVYTVKLELK